ncbi:MAG: hypothetical protein ACOX2P_09905 [Bacillota bacterium]|jgi:hypothetical protein
MYVFAGMQGASVRMIPVLGLFFRDRCVHFTNELNYANPEKAHLNY